MNGTAAILKNMITSINNIPSLKNPDKISPSLLSSTSTSQQTPQSLIVSTTPTKPITIPQIIIQPQQKSNHQIANQNSNTIASLINSSNNNNIQQQQQKRNNSDKNININNIKTIKMSSSTTGGLLKTNGVIHNDDIIIDAKPILDSSSVDSDNSSHSKASNDDFDSNKKSNDLKNEKKKEKFVIFLFYPFKIQFDLI